MALVSRPRLAGILGFIGPFPACAVFAIILCYFWGVRDFEEKVAKFYGQNLDKLESVMNTMLSIFRLS